MSTKRIFFALWPDDRQRDRLRDVIGSVAKTVEGRAVDRRDWHVTLVFIGEFPASQVPGLLERASQIQVEPFRLSFDRMEFWPRPKIACMVAATVPPELLSLVAALNVLVQDFGVSPGRQDLSAAYHGRKERPRVYNRAIDAKGDHRVVGLRIGRIGIRARWGDLPSAETITSGLFFEFFGTLPKIKMPRGCHWRGFRGIILFICTVILNPAKWRQHMDQNNG